MQRESHEFYVRFLVSLMLSPSVPVSLSDINSTISEGRKKQIAAQLSEAGLITYVGKTKGRRWMMDDKLKDMLSQLVSVRPEVLVQIASQAELKFPDRFAKIRDASDRVRSVASGMGPLLVGAT